MAGLAMIFSAVSRVHSGTDLLRSDISTELCGGIGLVLAADGKKVELEQSNHT